MIRNREHGTHPVAIHAPGQLEFCPLFTPLVNQILALPRDIQLPIDLTIITWNNKTIGTTERTLEHFRVPYIHLGQQIKTWRSNRNKIRLTADYLQKVTTKYVMGIDAHDAAILPNFYQIIENFLATDCKLLFGAEVLYWPNGYRPDIQVYEESVSVGSQRYMNCGLWIGLTNFCRLVFERGSLYANHITEYPYSEQVCLKPIYQELYPDIKVDHRCQCFQNLNKIGDILEIYTSPTHI